MGDGEVLFDAMSAYEGVIGVWKGSDVLPGMML
jgi:hypothetical protein